ncbi:TetR/AcrR family transcriptional repressor of nem operon [Granulicella aggregans]|uniref:TetR/AcrR family transcriptional repressor of nem operon n=2 Tax=Granulicella aggregans TaxID=474949 RepID=A0A7W7ZE25_9BACT|nr:TetR/AcrR family transcriptional repressor of nem operon [Granulicella aggregans]
MAAAGLTRGAFYRHFASKDELIAEANGSSSERLYSRLQNGIIGKSQAKALENIVSIYLSQAEQQDEQSPCTLAMIGAELSHYDRGVRDVAVSAYDHIVQLIASQLPQQNKKKRLRIASGIVSTMVGAVTLARIAPDAAVAKTILANAKAAVLAAQ